MIQRILFALILSINFFSCKETPKQEKDLSLLHATPYNAAFIIQINDKDTFNKTVNHTHNTLLFNKKLAAKIPKIIAASNQINTSAKLLLAAANSGDALAFLAISKTTKTIDTVKIHAEKVRQYNKTTIRIIKLEETDYYFAHYKSLVLTSSSQLLIENAIRQLDEKTNILSDSIFTRSYKTINTNNVANILINNKQSDFVLLNPFSFDNTTYSNKALTSWTALDVSSSKDQLLLNGVCLSNDDTNYLEAFKNIQNSEQQIYKTAPINTSQYKSIALANFKPFVRALSLRTDNAVNKLTDSIFNAIKEVAIFRNNQQDILALRTKNPSQLKQILIANSKVEQDLNYRDTPIFELDKSTYFQTFLAPFIQKNEINYYYQSGTIFYFAKTQKALKMQITATQNHSLIKDNKDLIKLFEASSDNALLIWEKPNKNSIKINQYNYSDGIAYCTLLAKNKLPIGNALEQENITISTAVKNTPQFFYNFKKKTKQLVLFEKNKIALLDAKGKLLWEKEIAGSVLGKIKEIDIYKNNKKQLLFATEKAIYCFDINGNSVAGFPIKTKGITQGVQLFDYDKNKTYRIAVTKGKELVLYNAKGKHLNGFKFKAKRKINSLPQHFRSFDKDYIVLTTKDGHLHILNRRGQPRTKVNEQFKFSDNPICFVDRFITFTTKKGEEIQVNIASGKVQKKVLNLNKNHFFYTDKRNFIIYDNNTLSINSKKVTLPLGKYNKPFVLQNNNKTFMFLFDKEHKQLYCYDDKCKLQANFPIFASEFVQATQSKGKLLIITQEDNADLIKYRF